MSSCYGNSDCPSTYYCSFGTGLKGICKAKKYSGETCDSSVECSSGYYCSSISKTCKSYSSLSLGEKCNKDDAVNQNCAYGYYCHFPYSSATSGTCKYKKGLYESCQTYQWNQCQDNYYCSSLTDTCRSNYSGSSANTILTLAIVMPLIVFFIIVAVVVCICRRKSRARLQKLNNANRAASVTVISPYVHQPMQAMTFHQPIYDPRMNPPFNNPDTTTPFSNEYYPDAAQNIQENISAPMNEPPAYSGPTDAPPSDVKRPME